jgi:hypothetical protein
MFSLGRFHDASTLFPGNKSCKRTRLERRGTGVQRRREFILLSCHLVIHDFPHGDEDNPKGER